MKFVLMFLLILSFHCRSTVNYDLDASPNEQDEKEEPSSSNVHNLGLNLANGGAPNDAVYVAHSPLVPCTHLPRDFLDCSQLSKSEEKKKVEPGHGCVRKGAQRFEDVPITILNCRVLQGIACYGKREFVRESFSCVKYTGHYFLTTLIYSILLGFLGFDRFSIGHTGTAIGKLLTLGGLGIWWIVDIVLLITGNLTPEDGSNWTPIA